MADFIDSEFRQRYQAAILKPALILMGINAAIWLIVTIAATLSAMNDGDPQALFSALAMPSDPAVLLKRIWTPITYMWTHASFIHLAVNMLWLFWFWRLLDEFSTGRLIAIYIGGGLAGALFFFIASIIFNVSDSELCGASACVIALMGATAVAYPRRRVRFLFSDNVRLLWIVAGAIILTFAGSSGILSFAAHLGGLAAGASAVFFIQYQQKITVNKNNRLSRRQTRRFTRTASAAIAAHKAGLSSIEKPDNLQSSGTTAEDLQKRLDTLLDKISTSGYASLSSAERNELNEISSKLGQ